MDKTRKLRRALGYEIAKLHGLQESVDLTHDDASTKTLALQVRQQAGVCLDLLDQYQSSVPGRMWLDAERRCRPLREDLRRTEKLFRSNSGEWEGSTLTRSDLHRMCDWTWEDFHEPVDELSDLDPIDAFTTALCPHPGSAHTSLEALSPPVPDAFVAPAEEEGETDGATAGAPLRFTLPMDEESRGHVLMVLVPCETGFVYEHQYGGPSGRLIEIEGYLVPASAPAGAKAVLEQFFLSELGGDSVSDPDHVEALNDVKEAIRQIRYRGTGDRMAPLEVNEARFGELDEAWVPVLTPDGPGYLAWINAD